MAPLRKPLIGFFSHSLHFGWKGACVLPSPQNTVCITLLCCCCCFFFLLLLPPLLLPPRPSPSLALSLLPSHSASRRLLLSPHLMRPHNNTAVVQLFCYLSQTAGLLHSVFRAPFTCLLRQGNEYHLELQSTSPQKRVVRHLRSHLRRMCQVELVRRFIKAFHIMDFSLTFAL